MECVAFCTDNKTPFLKTWRIALVNGGLVDRSGRANDAAHEHVDVGLREKLDLDDLPTS